MDVEIRHASIEAVLEALSRSPDFLDFVVRGSVASRDWMGPYSREPQDLDLLYLKATDTTTLTETVFKFLKLINFHKLNVCLDKVVVKPIWQDSMSPGVRYLVPFESVHQYFVLQLDVAIGDPLCRAPEDAFLKANYFCKIPIRRVKLEIAAGWKLHGLFEHINGPWQSKTLWDLYVFSRFNNMNLGLLVEAIEVAFTSRLDPLEILRRFLFGDFGQSKHSLKNWEKDFSSFNAPNFIELKEVIDYLRVYLKPILKVTDDGSLRSLSDLIEYRIKILRQTDSEEARLKLKGLSYKKRILRRKAYDKIPHVPGSRVGPSEKHISHDKFEMLTGSSRLSNDEVIIQEKLDGSCVCAYRQKDKIIALGREGDLASLSPNESRRLWSDWVELNHDRFLAILLPGERLVGEWLAMAHGTRYRLIHEPFVAFDLFTVNNRALGVDELVSRVSKQNIVTPKTVYRGPPCSLSNAVALLESHHGAIDPCEGLIWRLERNSTPLFRAKYVASEKIDGCFLPEKTGEKAVWNWHPNKFV